MSARNTPDRWGWVARTLHWATALGVIGLVIVGLWMDEMPNSPDKVKVFALHKSTGLLVLALVIARLGWRFYAGKPEPVPGTPTWQERIATVTHWLLYGLILLMPVSGWLYDSASGLRPFRWFGLFDMPKLVAPNEAIRDASHNAHEWLFWVLVALVLAHAGAAFYHHVFQRDATLTRMLPQRRSKPADPVPTPSSE